MTGCGDRIKRGYYCGFERDDITYWCARCEPVYCTCPTVHFDDTEQCVECGRPDARAPRIAPVRLAARLKAS
jgi:hypothetical protein